MHLPDESDASLGELRRKATPPRSGSSVLGADVALLGDNILIISQSKLVVDTYFMGNIHAKEVVVGPAGSLHGEVWAERIDLQGEILGSLIAVDLVLQDSAKASGEIMYQSLSVAEGAELEARAHLIRDPGELMPILDARALARGRNGKDDARAGDETKAA
jgi:cytoskeletal protein CcmA (bactofilin family)